MTSLSIKEILISGFLIIFLIGFGVTNNGIGIISTYGAASLLVLTKLLDIICDLRKELEAIKTQLKPLDKPKKVKAKGYNVESIPRLLSSIKCEDGKTLFDTIVESSTSANESLNLVKAHNQVIEALNELEINGDSRTSK